MVEANMQNQAQPTPEEMKSPQDMQFATPNQQSSQMAMDGGAAQNAPPMTSLKMKGLPFSVTREEILTFFQGTNMLEDSVKIGQYPDGRLTGEACVLFNSDAEC